MMAMAYGNVYVAQVALGANDMQTVRAFLEAEAWHGPSLVDRVLDLHRPRDRHGDVDDAPEGRRAAAATGRCSGSTPAPTSTSTRSTWTRRRRRSRWRSSPRSEARFSMLARSDPDGHRQLMELAQERRRGTAAAPRAARRRRTDRAGAPGARGRRTPRPTGAEATKEGTHDVIDLTTTYLGTGAAFAARGVGLAPDRTPSTSLRRLEDAGVAAVVLPSLFEEQITHEELHTDRHDGDGRRVLRGGALVLPGAGGLQHGPGRVPALVEEAKSALSIPVIASMNGVSDGWWVRYARLARGGGRGRDGAERLLHRGRRARRRARTSSASTWT